MRIQSRILVLAGCAFALTAASCRVPAPPLMDNPAVGYIYDPKTAEAIAERFPATKALYERDRAALAEPISVVAWEEDHSEWQVFFATNRTPNSSGGASVSFGADWGNELSHGVCRVSLPKAERGKAADGPSLAARLARFRKGHRANAAAEQPQEIRVESPTVLDDPAYFQSLREAVDRAPEHDVLVFVHGFNVDFASSVTRAAQIGLDLPFNGAIVAYSWPSQGGAGNYREDEGIVEDSVDPFVRFLDQLDAALPPDTRLHILVHSMGNRLVLNGLGRLPERFRETPRFTNIILAAPDVGARRFLELAPDAVASAKRVTLYVCDSDTALVSSKAINGEQRIGDAYPPIVVPGVETVDASAIETSFMGHSYYGSNRRALSDLFALVKQGRSAAERQWLRAESGSGGQWWVFSSQPEEIRVAWHFEHLAPPQEERVNNSPRRLPQLLRGAGRERAAVE